MKQKIVSLVTSVLTVLTVTTAPFTAAAAGKTTDYTIKDYAAAESYYNRVVLSKSWQNSDDRNERGEMLQLPAYMLNRMTTDALVEAVLDYPYFYDIYAFDDVQEGVDLMMQTFNGVRELADRDDVASVLLDKYSGEEVLTDASSADAEVFRLTNLEVLLSQDFVTTKFNKKEKSKFVKNIASKMDDKIASPVYGDYTNNLVFELTEENSKDSSLLKNMESVRDSKATSTYVKTPNGTKVAATAYSTEPLSSSQISSINKKYDAAYPKAKRLRSASGKYNCHSYAWYSTSTSNNKWINNPSAYWGDKSYKQTTTVKAGRKIIYVDRSKNTLQHSSIVYSVSNSTITVNSKWGKCGLYRHSLTNSPYTNCKYYCFYR